jgi:hypothetical protein
MLMSTVGILLIHNTCLLCTVTLTLIDLPNDHAYAKWMVRPYCSSMDMSPTGTPFTGCKPEGRREAIQKDGLTLSLSFYAIRLAVAMKQPRIPTTSPTTF